MILKQKYLHIFSVFFFVCIHFFEAKTCKCIARFAYVDPEYRFAKKFFTKCLRTFSTGQSIDKGRMNMQYISICK